MESESIQMQVGDGSFDVKPIPVKKIYYKKFLEEF
jgi:hypothetical protein